IRRERICTLRSNGPEGGGQDARHKLPGIKQVESPCRKTGAFLLWALGKMVYTYPVAKGSRYLA
ncbi:hypothetical protein, partial [Pectobacterium brasiliense]|uniref:hypothetical protein n=1 Tax=Pectobacterium brasiliense TaxID=180957 RepID=UPI002A821A3F